MSPVMTTEKSAPRMRASLACQSCRRRKVKCDVQCTNPGEKCTQCQQLNTACLINRDGDRRKSGSRRHIETLESRIHTLESLLRKLPDNRRSVSSGPREETNLGAVDEETSQGTVNSPTSQDGDIVLNDGNFDEAVVAETQPQEPMQIEPDISTFNLQRASPQAYYGHPASPQSHHSADQRSTRSEQNSGILNKANRPYHGRDISSSQQETARNGKHSSKFGLTSPLHVWQASKQQPPLSMPDELAEAGIGLDMNSTQLCNNLIQLYFEYQKLWVSIVDQRKFMEDRQKGIESPWYSPFLETTVLACATRLSTSRAVRALGQKYVNKARESVPDVLETPSPSFLQGLLMLSEYEVTQGNERPGWMFCGMACRMLVELGLHNPKSFIHQHEDEAFLYYRLLCACISYEGIWCMYLGRPSSISRTVIDRAVAASKDYNGPEAHLLASWVKLCAPMSEICEILNCDDTSSTSSASSRVKMTKLAKLEADLQKWRSSLPPGIAIDESRIFDLDPSAYGMHMQYCKVQIFIHKVYCEMVPSDISNTNVDGGDHQRPLNMDLDVGVDVDPPKKSEDEKVVYDHALRICQFLLTYRQIHGIEKIPSITLDNTYLALAVLISHFLGQPSLIETSTSHLQWIRLTISTLNALQSHFPIIQRMLSTLRHTVEGSSLTDLFSLSPLSSAETPRPSFPLNSTSQSIISNHINQADNTHKTWPASSHRSVNSNETPQQPFDGPHTFSQQQQPIRNQVSIMENPGSMLYDKYDGQRLQSSSVPFEKDLFVQDTEELSASLLSWPDLQLASLWQPMGMPSR